MKILTRYVARAYLKMLSLCLGSFVAIYLVVDFMERISRLTRAGGSFAHIALYFALKIPEFVIDSAPLAVLMATLLTLGTLSLNSELTAMRSCGVSLARISAPILAIAVLVSLAVILLSEAVVPKSFVERNYVQDVLIEKQRPTMYFRQQNIWYREETSVLRASLFDPEKKELKGITLWELDPVTRQPIRRTDATSGLLAEQGWLLSEAVVRQFRDGELASTTRAAKLPVQLNLKPADLKVLGKYSDSMSLSELNRYCKKLRAGGHDPTRYLTQMHSRISLPFGCAIMAFLGIPFAVRGGRSSGIAFGIGLSLGLGFLYVIANSFIISAGQVGLLPPVVAAWATNFIFLLAGAWLSLTVEI